MATMSTKRDWNLVIWVHHQEQFFLSMFKVVWRKNFRLPTIWQIFGIDSARKRENWVNSMHILEKIREVVESRCKNFFHFNFNQEIFTNWTESCVSWWNWECLPQFCCHGCPTYSVLLFKTHWLADAVMPEVRGGADQLCNPIQTRWMGQILSTLYYWHPHFFFTFRHPWEGQGDKISWKLSIISKQQGIYITGRLNSESWRSSLLTFSKMNQRHLVKYSCKFENYIRDSSDSETLLKFICFII